MSEMIDRIAKAIQREAWSNSVGSVPWDKIPVVYQEGYRKWARKAVEAIREPTEAMCDMAIVTPNEYADGDDGRRIALTKPADVWRTMIDEALK